MKTKLNFFILLALFLSWQESFSQSYGLGFNSHEVVQDQRTALDLSPAKALCFDDSFELAFDLSFFPKRANYFGYIVRLVGNDNQNIDLIYDKDRKEVNHFKVIIGDHFTNIAFNIQPSSLFNSWNTLKIKFDHAQGDLVVTSGKFIGKTKISLKERNCFKILFGANESQRFKTSDNTPMKIRNVGIKEGGKQKYYWPLNESDGKVVKEEIKGHSAVVNNPSWIKKLHFEWQLLSSFAVNGAASVAFDAKNESVIIIERDSLKTFSIHDNVLKAVSYQNNFNLLRGNHSVYDDRNNRLLNFYVDQKTVSIFDKSTNKWTKDYNPNTPITDFWQFNKFYSPIDSSLYVFGGYGHFIYKNEIQQYKFSSSTWSNVEVNKDILTPRYLAGLGFDGNGAYIVGGYGSSTGKQMLNPKNLYDFLYFDVKKKSIKKLYELKVEGEDFVFANSLIINQKNRTYYALIFPQNKFNSSLQLIEGSLNKPEYELRGNKIPFKFHDINSYADLYYSAISKKFIAVTTFRDSKDITHVRVYALNASPLSMPIQNLKGSTAAFFWYLLFGFGSVAAIMLIWYVLKRRKEKALFLDPLVAESCENILLKSHTPSPEPETITNRNSIFLFGNFQVFNKEGTDITKLCTPLVKELFLLVFFYTIKRESGISSEKLNEILWFDKSEKGARNNRSVNIAKLRNIFEGLDHCFISKDTGYWKIDIDKVYVDYLKCHTILKEKKQDKNQVINLMSIVQRGGLLLNTDYPWLDDFKSEVSNEIIDLFLNFSNSNQLSLDPEFAIQLTNCVLDLDPVNEDAIILKCKSLALLGRHTLAKSAFEKFTKEYNLIYGEDFSRSFRLIMN